MPTESIQCMLGRRRILTRETREICAKHFLKHVAEYERQTIAWLFRQNPNDLNRWKPNYKVINNDALINQSILK